MDTIRSMAGKTCVITGATSGIGKATALALGSMGARLVLTGRNADLGQRVVEQIRSQPNAGTAEFLRADLSDLQQVRKLASDIAARHAQIDILINNAGAKFDVFRKSPDGHELTFATNHLGHFLLTGLLLERILCAPSGRVITVGSGAHSAIRSLDDWLLTQTNYDRKTAYSRAKLANVMFAYELARRLRGTPVTSNSLDPGGVATNLGRNNGLVPWLRHIIYYSLHRQLLSPRRGAETIVYLAASETVRGVTGKYFFQQREVGSSAVSHDPVLTRKLWSLSVELTRLDETLGPAWQFFAPRTNS